MSQPQPQRQGQYAGQRYGSAADVRSVQRQQAYGPRTSSSGDAPVSGRQGSYSRPSPEPRITGPPLLSDVVADQLQKLPPPTEWPAAALSYFVFQPMQIVLRMMIDVVVSPRTHRIVLRLSVLLTLFWSAFALAIAAYVGFYRAWVPDIGVTRSVWLQYGHDAPPSAMIDLTSPGDSSMGIFAGDQQYDVSLDLIVPLSAANLDLGNFMIGLELRSPLNHTVYHISKPSIIVHEPAAIRAVNNVVFQLTRQAPTLILPTSSPPVQLMTISLLDRTVLQPAHSAHPFATPLSEGVSQAIVTVGRHDADRYWRYGGGHGVGGLVQDSGGILKAAANAEGFRSRGELQTHSASLRFDAHLTGLRYFMYHHPLASFFIFTALFMTFEMFTALTLWAIAAFYTSTMTQPSLEIEDNYLGAMRGGRRSGGRGRPTTDTDSATPRAGQGDDGYGSDTVTGAESDAEDISQESASRQASTQPQDLSPRQSQESSGPWAQGRQERQRADDRLLSPLEYPSTDSPYDELGGLVDQPRRVLGRLDEETEEDTDARSTATSAGWENVGEIDDQFRRSSPEEEEQGGGRAAQGGLRQRRAAKAESDEDDERESEGLTREGTLGGSATTRSSTAASFGASPRPSTTPGTSSAAGPSRLTSQTPAEIKQEESESTELETDDSDEKRPAREAGSEEETARPGEQTPHGPSEGSTE